ncbi:hypothetical protein GGR54DRAFT_613594 [Hypoxylon sp. NC1633]|nr:hypothetical protein GGR54DRAFT_613594 [Hypoxylon sp. NC1633]
MPRSYHEPYPQPRSRVERRKFHADFYAFKCLFKGLGCKQRWLTPVTSSKLLDVLKGRKLLHGNPHM